MGKGWETGFAEADADKDEHISGDEAEAFFGHVTKIQHKHFLSESEKSVVRTMMKAFDADRDKHVSMKELMEHVGGSSEVQAFVEGWKGGFREADADFDGLLDAEEMGSLVTHVTRKHRSKLLEEAEATAAQVVDGFDADKDGKISLKELQAKVKVNGPTIGGFKGWQAGFKEADKDKDGQLTAEELATWFKSIGEPPKHDEM